MNRYYKDALVNELIELKVITEDERDEMMDLINNYAEDLTGNFDEDYDFLEESWTDWKMVDEEESNELEDMAQSIDEVVNSLKIGFNVVPGVGAGFCSNEEDLSKMKEFVRGALTVMKMMNY